MGPQIDRRDLFRLGALAAAPSVAGAAALPPAFIATVRVCNTAHHDLTAVQGRVRPGLALEVREARDPAYVNSVSSDFWLGDAKLGDAPRRSRSLLGRMLRGGRVLTAQLYSVEPDPAADDGLPPTLYVSVFLDRTRLNPRAVDPVDEAFLQGEAERESADVFVAEVGAVAGRAPVFLAVGAVSGASGEDAPPSTALRLVRDTRHPWRHDRVLYQTLDGAPLGGFGGELAAPVARMLDSGLLLGAVVLPSSARHSLWTALYLLS